MSEEKKVHTFWKDQPVPLKPEEITEKIGVIQTTKKVVKKIRSTPWDLPAGLTWCDVNLKDEGELNELYELLRHHYVEDDDGLFRFQYSPEFLRQHLCTPNARPNMHIGMRQGDGELVGFISGLPNVFQVHAKEIQMTEVNFLCLKGELREKKLAPILIKELTRRSNMIGIFQAIFTAGQDIIPPVATARYYHRLLNPAKLVRTHFAGLPRGMSMKDFVSAYRLPFAKLPADEEIRKSVKRDHPHMMKLYAQYTEKFAFKQKFSKKLFSHRFRNVPGVFSTYVHTKAGVIDSFFSFYHVDSAVLSEARFKYPAVRNSYIYQYALAPGSSSVTLEDLGLFLLIAAKEEGADVVSCLNVMDNASFIEDHGFDIGDGTLNFHFYNYRWGSDVKLENIGVVLV